MTRVLALAAVMTLANAAKPAVVDDAAYLLFARHLAAAPLDPYGFELFWYARPDPAMHVLLPPVVPYWLAAGVAVFGERLVLLKLWLFPFAAAFCVAADALLRRFARGYERTGLVLLALSPAVLPLFNFMLDVPAVALGLAAVAAFVHGCDRGRFGVVVFAGVVAGLAMQTKYTMLTVPAVMLGYGLLHRRVMWAVIACVVAAELFATWECIVLARYDESHFWHHVRDQNAPGRTLADWVDEKVHLWGPLVHHVGGLACGWGLLAARGLGVGPRVLAALGVVAVMGLIAVAVVPGEAGVFLRSRTTGSVRLDLPGLVFATLGYATLAAVVVAAYRLGFRRWRPRRDAATWFLLGWLAIEVAAYFALTPFPAARRVMMVCVVAGLLVCRFVSRARRLRLAPPRWVPAFGVACGVALLAVDAWDALPERELARTASRAIGDRGGHAVWFQGHWGWQYYCDRERMTLIEPGVSHVRAGDWLVLPVLPDDVGFYRPYHGGAEFELDETVMEWRAGFVWDDWLACQTVPALYGGPVPFRGRDHPRLRVAVYRATRDWTPAPRVRR